MKFVVKNFYLFRAKPLNGEELKDGSRKFPAQIFDVLERPGRRQFLDLCRNGFSDSRNFGERFFILQIRQASAPGFDGAGSVRVSSNFERVFTLQLEQGSDFLQDGSDLSFCHCLNR